MKVNPIPEGCHSITPYLLVPDVGRLIEFLKKAGFNFTRKHVSVPMMKNRIVKAAFAAPLNRVSLLCRQAFAVIPPRFRCSAFRFRCYRITAKSSVKTLIENDNISNKSAENGPKASI